MPDVTVKSLISNCLQFPCGAQEAPKYSPAPKTYDRIVGAVQCLRGKAFRVESSNGPNFFVDKKAMVRSFSADDPVYAEEIAQDQRVRQAFLRAVAPFGDWHGTTDVQLCRTLGKIHEAALRKEREIMHRLSPDQLIEIIENVNPRALPMIGPEALQPGDIIFTKLDDDAVESGWEERISGAQKIARAWTPGPRERDTHRHVHVGMYVGGGKIAEAMLDPDGGPELRMVDLDHPYYQNPQHHYVVSRLGDSELAEAASQIARTLTYDVHEDFSQKIARRYNMTTAALSVFRTPWKLQITSLLRVLHGYQKLQHGEGEDLANHGAFHCSYFVPYVYQLAEACRIMPELEERFNVEPPPTDGTIERVTEWAKTLVKQMKKEVDIPIELQDQVIFKINAHSTCPQELRMFMTQLKTSEAALSVEEFRFRLA